MVSIVLLLIIPTISYAADQSVRLLINGKRITQGAPAVVLKGSTYIPLRNLFENIDFSVEYQASSKSAVAWYNKGAFKVTFIVGSNIVELDSTLINGKAANVRISGTAIVHNGSVYVPLRAFGELFNASVSYDSKTYTVYFKSSDDQIKSAIYPKIGNDLIVPVVEPVPVENKPLTAKEIYQQSVAVGYVEVLDINNNPVCSGSGFMIYPNIFVTNFHVASCSGTGKLTVKMEGTVYNNGDKGWFLFDNKTTDLYGSYISTTIDNEGRPVGETPSIVFNLTKTDLPEIGDKVYAIGSPRGLENTIAEGIVSGIRTIDGITYIQHTADTDHGSSGGVLLDEYGFVIGVTSAGFDGTDLDFAIPISYLKDELDKVDVKGTP
jgi:hypothetical protein